MNIRYYENKMIGLVPETEQDKAWILGFWKKEMKDSDLQWEDIKVLEVWS